MDAKTKPNLLVAANTLEAVINDTWMRCPSPNHRGGTCDFCKARGDLRAAIAMENDTKGGA